MKINAILTIIIHLGVSDKLTPLLGIYRVDMRMNHLCNIVVISDIMR